MNQDGYGAGEFPPPPPELVQQQYLYGTVTDSRQQPVQSNYGYPQSQPSGSYAPGVGQTAGQKPQQPEVIQIPVSTKPIQVYSFSPFFFFLKSLTQILFSFMFFISFFLYFCVSSVGLVKAHVHGNKLHVISCFHFIH